MNLYIQELVQQTCLKHVNTPDTYTGNTVDANG